MRTLIKTLVLLAIAWQPMLSAAQMCSRFQSSTDDELLQFLQNRAPDEDPWCAVYALRALGHDRFTSATSTFIQYLDFETPPPRPVVHHGGDPPRYPAITALFEIGRPALPALLDVIRSNTDPASLKRSNAIETIMTIFREDNAGGVRLLRREADDEPDAKAALSLRRAATDAVRWCVPEVKSECNVAASGKDEGHSSDGERAY